MNLDKPLVSVIVPVYNVRKYIRECVESVLRQTYENIECVCVDDGSVDGSAEILEEQARKDSRAIVVHQKNSGVSAARNKALSLARGEFITFLDSDDVLVPDFIENAISAFSGDDELDVWIGQVLKVDEDNVEYPVIEQPEKPVPGVYCSPLRQFLRMRGRQYIFALYPKIYRTHIIKETEGGFHEGLSNGEDALFVTEVFSYAKKVLVDERICYRRRMRKGSLVGRRWANHVDDSLIGIMALQEFASKSPARGDLNRYVAQRALARFRVVFSKGYSYEFLCDYIKSLFNHELFRRAVCLPIIQHGPFCFRLPGAVIWALPKPISRFMFCLMVKMRILVTEAI